MFYFYNFFRHYFQATNQYGIHSPFVYKFTTNGLYHKINYKTAKSTTIVLKTLAYFSVKNFRIISKNPHIEEKIKKELNLIPNLQNPVDLIFLDNPLEKLSSEHNTKIHNNTVLVIANIYKNKKYSQAWKSLTSQKKVSVSIDLFYCGLIFFRKEQVKEHFKIRI